MDISRLPNFRIAALALWKIGGATSPQHQEDVAAKCFELAASRFCWSKYPQYPNPETGALALRDAKKSKNGALVTGNNRRGWLLSASGLEWVQKMQHFLRADSAGTTSVLRRDDMAELRALGSHKAFTAWKAQNEIIPVYQVADAVRLTADAPQQVIQQRIDELHNKARLARIPELQEYLEWLKANVAKER